MSREIKFRAWVENQSGFGSLRGMMHHFGLEGTTLTGYPIMQFTGLTDKNGKEIYEGDIVRCGEWEEEMGAEKWEVIFGGDNYAAFDLRGWEGEVNGLSYWLNAGVVEVLGDIYQNPELLK